MENDPTVVVTPQDVANPTLLYRVLANIVSRIQALGTRIDNVIKSIKIPTMAEIRQALQATGTVPINVNGLRGVLADPQPAAALRYNSAPSGLNLQGLKDSQFLLVTNGSGYDLYTVIGGNPNTLFKLIAGASGGTFMTLDTAQTVTSAGTKTVQAAWTITSPWDFQAYTKVTGTNTNDSAAAGYIGEVVSSAITGVSLTSGVNANITSVSLTAGDWDVMANVLYSPAATTSVTNFTAGLNTTSATLGPAVTRMAYACPAFVPAAFMGWPVPVDRVSIAVTTTVYLVAQATFTVSTMTGAGQILARRVR